MAGGFGGRFGGTVQGKLIAEGTEWGQPPSFDFLHIIACTCRSAFGYLPYPPYLTYTASTSRSSEIERLLLSTGVDYLVGYDGTGLLANWRDFSVVTGSPVALTCPKVLSVFMFATIFIHITQYSTDPL